MSEGLSSFSLVGKRALVTGASRGIGQALSVGLAAAGADVAVSARTIGALAETVGRIEAKGRRGLAVAMDAANAEACKNGVRELARTLGGLDILINNAGMEEVSSSLEVSEATWDRILDTNLKGAFFTAQAAAQAMQSEGGAILNICSLTSEIGIPTAAPYGSSKSGLLGMTRALAVEWAPIGIRVNALAPGYYRTALTEAFYRDPDWQAAMLRNVPLGRFGQLDDLVGAAVFLCSSASSYVTGVCLPVDGGTLASI